MMVWRIRRRRRKRRRRVEDSEEEKEKPWKESPVIAVGIALEREEAEWRRVLRKTAAQSKRASPLPQREG